MGTWTLGWIAWGAWFALLEGAALINQRPGDTLSEHVWRWLRVKDARPTGLTLAARGILGVALVWLLGHLTMGWWS